MNGNLRKLAALLLTALVALLAMGPMPAVGAANANPGVIPPQAHPYGHTYGEWGALWTQWAFSIPADTSPLLDTTGEFCAVGQAGPVWFLAPAFGGTVIRYCTVPAGKVLVFTVMGALCSPATDGVNGEEALRECARQQVDTVTQVGVTVDGVPLVGLMDNYRDQTPYSMITLPEDNLFGVPAQTTPFVGDNYLVVLAPLAAGEHTIQLLGAAPGLTEDITYYLTVAR